MAIGKQAHWGGRDHLGREGREGEKEGGLSSWVQPRGEVRERRKKRASDSGKVSGFWKARRCSIQRPKEENVSTARCWCFEKNGFAEVDGNGVGNRNR